MASAAIAPSVRAFWDRSIISPVALHLMWVGNAALGLVLILGDPRRAAGPTFSSVTDAGGPVVVGTAFLALGVLLALAPFLSRRLLAAAFLLATGGHLAFALGFLLAIAHEPPADDPDDVLVPLTGVVAYGVFIGGMHFLNTVLYARDRTAPTAAAADRKDPGA